MNHANVLVAKAGLAILAMPFAFLILVVLPMFIAVVFGHGRVRGRSNHPRQKEERPYSHVIPSFRSVRAKGIFCCLGIRPRRPAPFALLRLLGPFNGSNTGRASAAAAGSGSFTEVHIGARSD